MKIKQTGITLISLVITVIVLLILAGTTIGIVSNNSNSIKQVNKSKNTVERESLIQKINADIFEEKTTKGRQLNQSEIKNILAKKPHNIYDEGDNATIKGIVTKDGSYEILLSEIVQ